MNKILTVVIPTYNMEKYLQQCLDSLVVDDMTLLDQIEVLVINDGSNDSSSAIAHEYETKFPNTFIVIDKDNGNYGSCVNRGLKEASGKYIKVLDADDTFDKNIFVLFIKYLTSVEADCVLSDMVQVDEKMKTRGVHNYDLPTCGCFSLAEIMNDSVIDNLWMHCVCYRTDVIRQLKYYQTEGISYTDQEWLYLPMSACKKFSYFNNTLYRYLVGREGQTVNAKVWENNFWMEIKGIYAMMDLYTKVGSFNVDKNYLVKRLAIRIRTLYYAYFYRFQSSLNNDLMKELDMYLRKTDQQLYDAASKTKFSKYFPIGIVNLWRRSYDSDRTIIILLRKIFGILFKVKMHIKNN